VSSLQIYAHNAHSPLFWKFLKN